MQGFWQRLVASAVLATLAVPAVGVAAAPLSTADSPGPSDAADGGGSSVVAAVGEAGAAGYVALVPHRLLDTRRGEPVGGGEVINLVVMGEGGVPATGVDAVVLNVTAVRPSVNTWLTVYPTGSTRPLASNLNAAADQVAANTVVAKVGTGGSVSIYNRHGDTDIVVDVQGWFAADEGYTSLVPARLLDTRKSTEVGADEVRELTVLGEGGVPDSGVDSVVLNVTAVDPTETSWLTVYPAGDDVPLASNVNFVPGQTVPNLVIVKVGDDGKVAFHNAHGTVDVVVDVQGWFAPDRGYTSVVPSRLLDTREPDTTEAVGAGESIEVEVLGRGGVPAAGVDAVVLNVTATRPTVGGWFTVYPFGVERPLASNLNFRSGQTVPNVVIAKVGEDGKVSIENARGVTDVVVDVQGWFGTGDPTYYGLDSAWWFTPSHVTLPPGGSAVVRLQQVDGAGVPTNSTVPPGVQIEMSGPGDQLAMEHLGGDQWRVVAGDEVASVTVAARLPHWTIGAGLDVTIARVRPETVTYRDEQIVFPRTSVAPGADPLADFDPEQVGPFTWQEYADRLNMPYGVDSAELLDDLLTGEAKDYWYPVVLVGDAPPAGTPILGIEGHALLGVVIEPPGAPSLNRDGMSLVSVLYGGPDVAFLDYVVESSYEQDVALGLAELPTPGDLVTASTGEFDEPEAAPGPSRAPHRAQDTPASTPPPTTPPQNASVQGASRTTKQVDSWRQWPRQCAEALKNKIRDAVSGSVQAFEMDPAIKVDFKPLFEVGMEVRDGAPIMFRLRAGVTGKITIGLSGKFLAKATVELACPPVRLNSWEKEAPGELAAVLSFYADLTVTLKGGASFTAGPRLSLGWQKSWEFEAITGFSWVEGTDAQDLSSWKSTFTPPEQQWLASQPTGFSSGLSTDGVGFSMEFSLGFPFGVPAGIRVGGVTTKLIGEALDILFQLGDQLIGDPPDDRGYSELGKIEMIAGEFGPVAKATWENATNVLSNRDVATGVGATLEGKIAAKLPINSFLLSKFTRTTKGLEVATEIVFVQGSIALATLYAPLKSAELKAQVQPKGKTEYDDAPTTPNIFVQEDDTLRITSELAPQIGGAADEMAVSELTEGWLYRLDGQVWVRLQDITPKVIASTGAASSYGKTTLQVDIPITPSRCDAAREEVVTYALIGNAPPKILAGYVPGYAWGDKFDVKCVDGKVAIKQGDNPAPTPVKVRPTEPTVLTVHTSGAYADKLEIVAVTPTTIPTWLTIEPTTKTVQAKTSGEDTFELKLSIQPDGPPVCEERQATIRLKSKDRGSVDLVVKESEKCYMHISPTSVTGPGPVSTTMTTEGYVAGAIQVEAIKAQLPSWITMQAPTATDPADDPVYFLLEVTDGTPQVVPLQFTIATRIPRCVLQPARAHIIEFFDAHRGTATFTLRDPSVPARENCGLHFTPDELAGGGTTQLKLIDDELEGGVATADWDITGEPDWMEIDPVSGTFTQGGHEQIVVSGSPPYDVCSGRPEQTVLVYASAELPSGQTKDATLKVRYEQIDPIDCPDDPVSEWWGDPHLRTMDGLTLDTQVLGEYVFVEPTVDDPSLPTVWARTELTNPAASGAARPTSVTAVAVEVDGHLVEVYGRPSLQKFLDGVEYNNVYIELGATSSLNGDANSVVIQAGEVTIEIIGAGGTFDLVIHAPFGAPLRGLAGTPNGNPADDLTLRTGGTISETQGREHSDDLYSFTESWRLTDVADSPFALGYDGFAAANPPHSLAELAPFIAEVEARLGDVSKVCRGSDSYLVGQLALELAIGRELDDVLVATCGYIVQGQITASGFPAAGMEVSLDANGLQPCVATTMRNGWYVCRLEPDLDEAAALSEVGPITVNLDARFPGESRVVTSGSTTFTTLAPIGSTTTQGLDLVVDPSELTRVRVSGTATRNGVPVDDAANVHIVASDASGELMRFNRGIDPAADGTYELEFLAPYGTTSVTMEAWYGPYFADFPTITAPVSGALTNVAWDIVDDFATVNVHGVITRNGAPYTEPLLIVVDMWAADGTFLRSDSRTYTPAADGAYDFSVRTYRATTEVDVRFFTGPQSDYHMVFPDNPVAPGPVDLEIDVPYVERTIRVSGTVQRNGGIPPTAHLKFEVVRDAAPVAVTEVDVTPDPGDGSYTYDLLVPSSSTAATVTLSVPGASTPPAVGSVTLTEFLNEVPLSLSDQVTTLHVEGILSLDGVPLDGVPSGGGFVTLYYVTWYGYDADGNEVQTRAGLDQWGGDNYAKTTEWDSSVVRVRMFGLFAHQGNYVVVEHEWQITPGTANSETYSPNLTRYNITIDGVVGGGVPAPPGTHSTFTIRALTDGGTPLTQRTGSVDLDENSRAVITVYVPIETHHLELTFGASSDLWNLGPLTPGWTEWGPLPVVFNGSVLFVHGNLADFGAPVTSTLYATITPYSGGDGGSSLVPQPEMEVQFEVVDGEYGFTALMPADAVFATVRFEVESPNAQWAQPYYNQVVRSVSLNGTVTDLPIDWDTGAMMFDYHGFVVACPSVAYPAFTADLVLLASNGAYIRTVATGLQVVPDPATGEYTLRGQVPDAPDLHDPGVQYALVADVFGDGPVNLSVSAVNDGGPWPATPPTVEAWAVQSDC